LGQAYNRPSSPPNLCLPLFPFFPLLSKLLQL
jgi:hypothetical protein